MVFSCVKKKKEQSYNVSRYVFPRCLNFNVTKRKKENQLKMKVIVKSFQKSITVKSGFFFSCGPYVLEVSSKFRIHVPRNKSQSHTTPLIGLQPNNLSSEPILFLFCLFFFHSCKVR